MFTILCIYLTVWSTGGVIQQVVSASESRKPGKKVCISSLMGSYAELWYESLRRLPHSTFCLAGGCWSQCLNPGIPPCLLEFWLYFPIFSRYLHILDGLHQWRVLQFRKHFGDISNLDGRLNWVHCKYFLWMQQFMLVRYIRKGFWQLSGATGCRCGQKCFGQVW
jgi:hypothetical protein